MHTSNNFASVWRNNISIDVDYYKNYYTSIVIDKKAVQRRDEVCPACLEPMVPLVRLSNKNLEPILEKALCLNSGTKVKINKNISNLEKGDIRVS